MKVKKEKIYMNELVRLQKWLAETGVASRHEAERWIELGRVTVNGKKAILGEKVDTNNPPHIAVDGKPMKIRSLPPKVYWLLNKPDLILTSRSTEDVQRGSCCFSTST